MISKVGIEKKAMMVNLLFVPYLKAKRISNTVDSDDLPKIYHFQRFVFILFKASEFIKSYFTLKYNF